MQHCDASQLMLRNFQKTTQYFPAYENRMKIDRFEFR